MFLDSPSAMGGWKQYGVAVDSSTSALVLERLWLTDFRSHEALDLEFARGVTALVGPNGSGKTNIVEAIGWLMSMRSVSYTHLTLPTNREV